MVFNRKDSFFLDLSGEAAQPSVTVAPVKEAPASSKATAPAANAAVAIKVAPAPAAQASAAVAEAVAPAAATTAPVLTTAEEIAAQLAAEQATRPPASQVTFAPENLAPGAFVPRRRRGGANLAGFRSMASSLFRS
ncbi:MAG: hypothetical protein ACKOCM_04130 [Cyanobacteriota bacterium]